MNELPEVTAAHIGDVEAHLSPAITESLLCHRHCYALGCEMWR